MYDKIKKFGILKLAIFILIICLIILCIFGEGFPKYCVFLSVASFFTIIYFLVEGVNKIIYKCVDNVERCGKSEGWKTDDSVKLGSKETDDSVKLKYGGAENDKSWWCGCMVYLSIIIVMVVWLVILMDHPSWEDDLLLMGVLYVIGIVLVFLAIVTFFVKIIRKIVKK